MSLNLARRMRLRPGGPAAPSFVGSSSMTNPGNSTTPTITLPTGIAAGDIIVIGAPCFNTNAIATPAGFTLTALATTAYGNQNVSGYFFTKTADGSESGAAVTLALTTGQQCPAFAAVYRGVSVVHKNNIAVIGGNGSTTAATGTVTTTLPAFILNVAICRNGQAAITLPTPGANVVRQSVIDTAFEAFIADEYQTTPGVSTSRTLNVSSGGNWVGGQLALA